MNDNRLARHDCFRKDYGLGLEVEGVRVHETDDEVKVG